ncbi:putative reverse transcriptase domain-containing protein [Tanacetum coccineum]
MYRHIVWRFVVDYHGKPSPLNNDPNEFIPDQAPTAPVGFAPQWIGWQNLNNNNGWLDEDDDEEPKEDEADEDNDEEMEEEEDEEEEEIVAEDEAKIIYPYDEADPNNRPPPASDDESEFVPFVILVFDAKNRPVPPIIHFSSTYELGESSSAREILKDISEVYPLGPVPPTIGTAMSRIRKSNEQMRERAEVDERIVKKIDRSNLRIQMVGRDAMSLDGTVSECQANISMVISIMESMSLEFDRVRKESRRALELVKTLRPWPRMATMADDDVEDDDVEDEDDMDDDAADPSDRSLLSTASDLHVTPSRGPKRAKPAKNCTFSSFIKCGPTQFHGKEGAIELCRWFEKIKCTFGISECAERNKVKFAAATLQGRALTWWNTQVATLGLAMANEKSWVDLKRMMLEEFYPEEEISRIEDELRPLRLNDNDIAAYTNRFNELVLLCPNVVPSTKKKTGQYIKGLPSYIMGETYSSNSTTLNEAVRMAHGLMEHKIQGWNERNAEQNKRK